MVLIRKFHLLILSMIVLLGAASVYVLFSIKDKVVIMRGELDTIKKEILSEEDAIRILKAEISYLSSPKRLQTLSNKCLKLEPIKIAEPDEDRILKKIVNQEKTFQKNIKWRYKKGPQKYLMQASNKEYAHKTYVSKGRRY